jgi:hypothetical protein
MAFRSTPGAKELACNVSACKASNFDPWTDTILMTVPGLALTRSITALALGVVEILGFEQWDSSRLAGSCDIPT